jgi:hypothetical protein
MQQAEILSQVLPMAHAEGSPAPYFAKTWRSFSPTCWMAAFAAAVPAKAFNMEKP